MRNAKKTRTHFKKIPRKSLKIPKMPKSLLKSQKIFQNLKKSFKIPKDPVKSLKISNKYSKVLENLQKSQKSVEKLPQKFPKSPSTRFLSDTLQTYTFHIPKTTVPKPDPPYVGMTRSTAVHGTEQILRPLVKTGLHCQGFCDHRRNFARNQFEGTE